MLAVCLLQGNEAPVYTESFYFVSKHAAGEHLQVRIVRRHRLLLLVI
jgi:hypothetical protein